MLHPGGSARAHQVAVQIGQAYAEGLGVAKDIARSVDYYQRAAELAMWIRFSWPICIFRPRVVQLTDLKRHSGWLRWLNQGMPGLNVLWPNSMSKAQVLSPDLLKAAELYRKAADQDDVKAQLALGRLYERGRGVTRSFREAASWYLKAAELESAEGQYRSVAFIEWDEGYSRIIVKRSSGSIKSSEQGYQPA